LIASFLGQPLLLSRYLQSPAALVSWLAVQKITHLSLVPYLASQLLREPSFRASALPELRRVTVAGGSLDHQRFLELCRAFPNKVLKMYGLTEASTRVTCLPPEMAVDRTSSCGRPLSGVTIRVLDEKNEFLDPGLEGEIVIQGPNVAQGYFNDSKTTAEVFTKEGLRTGDVGFLDEDGLLNITDRKKDTLKVMGESVSARQIEGAVAGLSGVAEVAIVGVPDADRDEAIVAFVVEEGDGVSAEAIKAHCIRGLGPLRVPTHVRFVDSLPKSSSGKTRKQILRTWLKEE